MDADLLDLAFTGDVFTWRGPAPFYFVEVPADLCEIIAAVSRMVTYGWGVIPVRVQIGGTDWTTSLFPKEGRYLVPLKDVVRKAERLDQGDEVSVRLIIRL